MDIIREIGGDLVESVECFDTFENKQGRVSKAYRINY